MNSQLQWGEILKCLKAKLIRFFFIQKKYSLNAFENEKAELASLSFSFISKIKLLFISHLLKYQYQVW